MLPLMKQAGDKLEQLARKLATKRKLHMFVSIDDGADRPAEIKSCFFNVSEEVMS